MHSAQSPNFAISPVQLTVVDVRTTPSILSPLSGTVKSPGLNGLYYNLQCIVYSSQFLLHSPHTHTSHREWTSRVPTTRSKWDTPSRSWHPSHCGGSSHKCWVSSRPRCPVRSIVSWRRLSGRCTGVWWRGHSGSIRADMVSACRGMLCVGRLCLNSICVEFHLHKVVITLSLKFKVSYTIGFLVKKRLYLYFYLYAW